MNQDSFLVNDTKGLYAVADGVGGGMKGEVASAMAVKGLEDLTKNPTDRLPPIFQQLQKRVLGNAMQEFGEAVMGTTLSAVRFEGDQMIVCHAGDSRVYHFTQSTLKCLTEDHEFYDERVGGTVLASYLGLPDDVHPLTVSESKVPVQAGDRVLLCSDGLYRQMQELRITQLIRENLSDTTKLCQLLCEEAAKKEHSDNVTVVIIEIAQDDTVTDVGEVPA